MEQKLKFWKGPKNGHFPKGLVHDFVQKSKFLLSVFFTEIMPEKFVFQYLWKKRMILSGKKLSFKKAQKMDISKGVLSKNWIELDFVQKLNFLLSLFFTEIMSEKILFGYSKSETIIKRPENKV